MVCVQPLLALYLAVCLAFVTMMSITRAPQRRVLQSPGVTNTGCRTCPNPDGTLAPTPNGGHPYCVSRCTHRNSHCLSDHRKCCVPLSVLRRTSDVRYLGRCNCSILQQVRAVYTRDSGHVNSLALLKTRRRRNVTREVCRQFPRIFISDTRVSTGDAIIQHDVLSVVRRILTLARLGPALRISLSTSRRSVCCVGLASRRLVSVCAGSAVSRCLTA